MRWNALALRPDEKKRSGVSEISAARNNRTSASYDLANRLTGQQHPDGSRFIYTYDLIGNRFTASAPAGTFTTIYDLLSRPNAVTQPDGKILIYTYDALTCRCIGCANGIVLSFRANE